MKTLERVRSGGLAMKTLRALFAICAAITTVAAVPGQTVKPIFSVTISSDNTTVPAGSLVYIMAKLTNISDRVINCSHHDWMGLNASYDYSVLDESGKSVKKPDLHPEWPKSGSWRGPCTFKPGETLNDGISLTYSYDFSKPGKYTVQIGRRTTSDPKDDAMSNILTIIIVPEAKSPATQP